MSAGRLVGYDYDSVDHGTYQKSQDYLQSWAKRVTATDKKLKIGLRFSGNPSFEHEQHRRFPQELLVNATDIPDVDRFSLQRDNNIIPHDGITDLNEYLQSWEHTAALINEMDLVITSCTSIAHLSAAMGKPTWVIVPTLPYYIWSIPGDKSPWYSNVKIYRQTKYNDWSECVEKINNDLKELVGKL